MMDTQFWSPPPTGLDLDDHDGVSLAQATAKGNSSSSNSPIGHVQEKQNELSSSHLTTAQIGVLKQAKGILYEITKHCLNVIVLCLQLWTITCLTLFRCIGAPKVLEWIFSALEDRSKQVAGGHAEETSGLIPMHRAKQVCTGFLDCAYWLLEFFHRINRIATLLEAQLELPSLIPDSSSREARNSSGARARPIVGMDTCETPPVPRASASHFYYAALSDNKTFEDLLASLDGERALGMTRQDSSDYSKGTAALRGEEARSHYQNPHPQREILVSASRGKYSIRNSPSWQSRLGHLTSQSRREHASSSDSCSSLKTDVRSGSVELDSVEKQPGTGATEKSPSPDVVRCGACDRTSHHRQPSISKGKGKGKVSTNILVSPQNVIPRAKNSHIPRSIRQSAP